MLKNFKTWLQNNISDKKVRSDCISRCKRVENQLHISLDDEYLKDHGKNLLYLLTYSKDDWVSKREPKCAIVFMDGANLFIGFSSLRSAVNKYFLFMDENR